MDFNTTIDIIIKDLDEARAIIDDLKKYPGVPALQVELAKAKCKSAGEVIALLKKLHNPVPVEEKVEKIAGEPEKKEIPARKISTARKPEPVRQSPVIKEEVHDQPLKKSAESNILADKFSNMPGIFNEQHGTRKNEEDISYVHKTKPVNNLADAIGVNDKFLFMREVFNGNPVEYDEALNKLNRVENISDAKAIIMSYTGESDENEAVKQLLELVKRKLPSDE